MQQAAASAAGPGVILCRDGRQARVADRVAFALMTDFAAPGTLLQRTSVRHDFNRLNINPWNQRPNGGEQLAHLGARTGKVIEKHCVHGRIGLDVGEVGPERIGDREFINPAQSGAVGGSSGKNLLRDVLAKTEECNAALGESAGAGQAASG